MSVRLDPGHYTVTPRKPKPPPPPPQPSYPTAELGGSQYDPPPASSPTQAVVDAIAPVISGGATGVPRRVATAPTVADYIATTQRALQAHYLGTTTLGTETALADLTSDAPEQNAATPQRRLSERSLTDALTKSAAQVGATVNFAAGRAQAGPAQVAFPNAVVGGGGGNNLYTGGDLEKMVRPVGLGVGMAGVLGARGDASRPEARGLVSKALESSDLPRSNPVAVARALGDEHGLAQAAFAGAAPQPENPKIQGPDERHLARRLAGAAQRSAPGLLNQLDRAFAPSETVTPQQAAILAESVGLPGATYAEIAKGESSYHPNIVGTDPGGTHGLGLWQMTPGVQSRETKKAWDAIARQHEGGYKNPVANAEMAAYIAQGGTGVSNYFGTGFVTDPDAHLPGGQAAAQKALGGDPVPIPDALRARAQNALGRKAAREVIAAARNPGGSGGVTSPQPHLVKGFLQGVEISAGLPDAADLGVKHDGVVLRNIHPELQRALIKLGQQTGTKPIVNEGFRTEEYQAYLAGTVSGPVADPGTSHHESGLAVDLDNWGSYSAEQLQAAGLVQYVGPSDPEHMELINRPQALVGPMAGDTAAGSTASGGTTTTTGATAPAAVAGAGAGLPAPGGGGPAAVAPTFSPPIASPLAARAVLPGDYQGLGSQQDLEATLNGSSDSSELAANIEAFRPSRRLR